MRRFSLLFILACAQFYISGQTVSGDWYGTLDVMGQKLPLVLHLNDSLGIWKGNLDSPAQKAFGIPMTSLEVDGTTLNFTIEKLQVRYSGELTKTEGISGTFNQGSFKAKLNFTRSAPSAASTKKLQDPKEPYGYLEEDVLIHNKAEDFFLSGTITRPKTKETQKLPCIVLISGSGPQDRNEEILGHRPFLVLADRLTLAGYVVLRMDDRGTGKSQGTFAGATSKEFTQDIQAALEFLKSVNYIDTQRLILMGHSEGGMIANRVAAQDPQVYGVISLAGPGVLGSELLNEQQILISKANGATKKELNEIRAFDHAFYPLLTLDSIHQVKRKAEVFLNNYAKKIKDKDLLNSGIKDRSEWIKLNLEAYVNPWMIYFLNYDPAMDLKLVKCHYLALNGTSDLQVPGHMNLKAIKTHCNPSEGKLKRIKAMKDLNHLFQPSKTGNPNEYGSIEVTFDDSAIQEILNFLDDITR